jgi:hypothetical protein
MNDEPVYCCQTFLMLDRLKGKEKKKEKRKPELGCCALKKESPPK